MVASTDLKTEFFISAGVKANRTRKFRVEADGQFWYDVLKDIETSAEHSDHFPDIARQTLRAIEIREQLKKQGF